VPKQERYRDARRFGALVPASETFPRRVCRGLGTPAHDDRIDAVAHFQRAMMMDVNQAAQAMKETEAEIEDFLEGFPGAGM
jgi:hypothetical protein